MVAVQGFDVCRGVRSPFGDDGGITAGAAGFVAEFPAEDGRAGSVALNNEVDVSLVRSLGGRVSVEALVSAAINVGLEIVVSTRMIHRISLTIHKWQCPLDHHSC